MKNDAQPWGDCTLKLLETGTVLGNWTKIETISDLDEEWLLKSNLVL